MSRPRLRVLEGGRLLPSSRWQFDPGQRGYQPVYRRGERNDCPGCGRSHWHVGRIMAECAFCSCALPLRAEGLGGAGDA